MEGVIGLVLAVFVLMLMSKRKGRRSRRNHVVIPQSPTKRSRNVSASDRRVIPASQPLVTPMQEIVGLAYVTDGDGLRVKRTEIRLFGIDAPEFAHPYGKKAKWALINLCKGHVVTATVVGEDDYGRMVAKCFLSDGRDLSAEMVKLGLALDWPKYSGGLYRDLEPPDVRKKLWLADARQKGRMHVWEKFEARQAARRSGS